MCSSTQSGPIGGNSKYFGANNYRYQSNKKILSKYENELEILHQLQIEIKETETENLRKCLKDYEQINRLYAQLLNSSEKLVDMADPEDLQYF